jgi:hypothetical protein
MFLVSISANLAISFEFSLLVFRESSPRKEMMSCICLGVSKSFRNGASTYKTGTTLRSFQQILHSSSLQLQLLQEQIHRCISKEPFFGLHTNAGIGAQDVLGAVHAIMDNLDVLKIGVLYSEYRHLL